MLFPFGKDRISNYVGILNLRWKKDGSFMKLLTYQFEILICYWLRKFILTIFGENLMSRSRAILNLKLKGWMEKKP